LVDSIQFEAVKVVLAFPSLLFLGGCLGLQVALVNTLKDSFTPSTTHITSRDVAALQGLYYYCSLTDSTRLCFSLISAAIAQSSVPMAYSATDLIAANQSVVGSLMASAKQGFLRCRSRCSALSLDPIVCRYHPYC